MWCFCIYYEEQSCEGGSLIWGVVFLQIIFDIISFFGRFLGVSEALSERGNFVVALSREVTGYINIFMSCCKSLKFMICIFSG